MKQIADQLRKIADAEKIDVDEAALMLVARAGDGSMRDAQSAFDQVIAFAGDTITADDVTTVLGLVRRDLLIEVADAIAHAGCALVRAGRSGRSSVAREDRPPSGIGSGELRAAADAVRAVLPAPSGPQENGVRLGTLRRSENEEVRIVWLEWDRRLHFGVRVAKESGRHVVPRSPPRRARASGRAPGVPRGRGGGG